MKIRLIEQGKVIHVYDANIHISNIILQCDAHKIDGVTYKVSRGTRTHYIDEANDNERTVDIRVKKTRVM